MKHRNNSIEKKKKFFVIGLNYKKADAQKRGLFSIDRSAQTALLLEAKALQIPSLSVLSTCNRTELYGFADHPYQLIKLLCKYSKGNVEEFEKIAYIYKEEKAVDHIFKVGVGLDSQILGDFEIISQLRNSFKNAKEEGMLNTYMERLINAVIQAGKSVKNNTRLSSGATSVSFATVQYIRKNIPNINDKNILLFGTGKIGRNTVENLVKHTNHQAVSLINRTKVKAEKIGKKYNVLAKDFKNLNSEINQTDILIVATGAQKPSITPQHLKPRNRPLYIIDLSIPQNVAPEVDKFDFVHRIHLDELSVITEQTQQERTHEIPKAEACIEEIKAEFLEWVHLRRFTPTIRALKEKLTQIKENEIAYQQKKIDDFNLYQAEVLGDRLVQKIISQIMGKLRTEEDAFENSIELLSEVFQLESKNLSS